LIYLFICLFGREIKINLSKKNFFSKLIKVNLTYGFEIFNLNNLKVIEGKIRLDEYRKTVVLM